MPRTSASTPQPGPTPESVPDPTPPARPQAVLTFLYTGDTLGHLAPSRLPEHPEPIGGMARRATAVQRVRAQMDHVLLVDAGNVLAGRHQSSLLGVAFQGVPDIALMNELGYVAMGLGNHDLDDWKTLVERRQEAFFPILCANLISPRDDQPVLDTHLIVEEGGIRIALTSLANPNSQSTFSQSDFADLYIADPVETAQDLVPRLRAQADVVVVLGHQNIQDAYALINVVPGIDLVVAAPGQGRPSEIVQAGGVLIVEACRWGAYLGRLDVAVDGDQITSYSHTVLALSADVPADPGTEARIGTLQAELGTLYPDRFAPVGQAAADISNERDAFRETPLGNLVCDAVREQAQADIALIASSQLANGFFAGPIVVQDLYSALPYADQIVILDLIGDQVQQILDVSASASGTGSFSQVSGIRFHILGGVATDVQIDGRPLEAGQVYRVATTAQQAACLEGYKDLLSAAQSRVESELSVQETLRTYVHAHSPIQAHQEGRIITE